YDPNGNLTSQRRYYSPISSSFNLSTATLSTLTGQVTANNSRDEQTLYVYDAANRLSSKTDSMVLGTTADGLTNVSAYDENGNLTYRRDPDNFVTMTRYNAAGEVVETVAPNGSHSFINYDTGGLKIQAWTGGATGSQAVPATNVGASVSNGSN